MDSRPPCPTQQPHAAIAKLKDQAFPRQPWHPQYPHSVQEPTPPLAPARFSLLTKTSAVDSLEKSSIGLEGDIVSSGIATVIPQSRTVYVEPAHHIPKASPRDSVSCLRSRHNALPTWVRDLQCTFCVFTSFSSSCRSARPVVAGRHCFRTQHSGAPITRAKPGPSMFTVKAHSTARKSLSKGYRS